MDANVGRQGSCRLKVCVSCWGTPVPAGHFFSGCQFPVGDTHRFVIHFGVPTDSRPFSAESQGTRLLGKASRESQDTRLFTVNANANWSNSVASLKN